LPTGLNAVVASPSYSSGDVVVDGTIPIEDFRTEMVAANLAYIRTFGLLGRTAQVQAVVPIVSGTSSAVLAGQDTSRDLSGLADPQLRLAVNLKGGPARRRAEMAGMRLGTILGASLSLSLPLGHYDEDRYLNVGANRWAIKPELGIIQPLGRSWASELYAGVWMFGHNREYRETDTVTQDPLWAIQGHIIRLFGRRGWMALDATWVNGGATAVNDVVQNSFQRNTRLGATAGWFLGGGHALKAAFATGVYTRLGGDFDILSLGYQFSWGG
jgi:hypothetical protein